MSHFQTLEMWDVLECIFLFLFLQALKEFIHIDVEVYIAACDGEFLAHLSPATAVTCENPTMINQSVNILLCSIKKKSVRPGEAEQLRVLRQRASHLHVLPDRTRRHAARAVQRRPGKKERHDCKDAPLADILLR